MTRRVANMPNSKLSQKQIVTPAQLKQGWCEFGVPPIHREYEVLAKLPDGNYVVVAPEDTLNPAYRDAVAGIEH